MVHLRILTKTAVCGMLVSALLAPSLARGDNQGDIKALANNPMMKPLLGAFDEYTNAVGASQAAIDATPVGAALKVVRKVLTVVKIVHAIYTVLTNVGVPEDGALAMTFHLISALVSTKDDGFGKMIEDLGKIAERVTTGDSALRLEDASPILDMLDLPAKDRLILKAALGGAVMLRERASGNRGGKITAGEVAEGAEKLAEAAGYGHEFDELKKAYREEEAFRDVADDVASEARLLGSEKGVDWRAVLERETRPDFEKTLVSYDPSGALSRAFASDVAALERMQSAAEFGPPGYLSSKRGVDQALATVEFVLEYVLAAADFIARLEPLTYVEIPTVKEIVQALEDVALAELAKSGKVPPGAISAATQLLSGDSGSYWGDLKAIFMVSQALGVKAPGDLATLMDELSELQDATSMDVTQGPEKAIRALSAVRSVLKTVRAVLGK